MLVPSMSVWTSAVCVSVHCVISLFFWIMFRLLFFPSFVWLLHRWSCQFFSETYKNVIMNRILDIRHFTLVFEFIFMHTYNKLISSIDLSPMHILQYSHKFKTEYGHDNSISGRAVTVKISRWMSSWHIFIPVAYKDCFFFMDFETGNFVFVNTSTVKFFPYCSHNRGSSLLPQ